MAAPAAKPPIIVFGHIPKTAGSTLKTILWRQFGPHEVFLSMKPELHRPRFERLAESLESGARTQAIVTHAGYGFHEMLPDRYAYPYITFLREPIDRVISGYYMFVRQGRVPKDLPLEEYVHVYLKPGCNMQTSYLSGYFWACHREGRQPEREAFDDAMLERAKANLRRHAVVGLTERFDETMLLMQQRFGWAWRNMLYARRNVGHNRKRQEQVSLRALRAVEAYNQLDLELYAYATELFEEQLAAYRGDLDRRLAQFQRVNRLYAATVPRVKPVARPLVRTLRRLRGA